MDRATKKGLGEVLYSLIDNIVFKVALVLIMVILIGQTEISIGGNISIKKHKFSVLESVADTVKSTYKGYKIIKGVF